MAVDGVLSWYGPMVLHAIVSHQHFCVWFHTSAVSRRRKTLLYIPKLTCEISSLFFFSIPLEQHGLSPTCDNINMFDSHIYYYIIAYTYTFLSMLCRKMFCGNIYSSGTISANPVHTVRDVTQQNTRDVFNWTKKKKANVARVCSRQLQIIMNFINKIYNNICSCVDWLKLSDDVSTILYM